MHKMFCLRFVTILLLSASKSVLASGVITLAPHLTELAFAAGITPVAVSAYSDYPPAAKQLEQVADWQSIKVERILALKPDVVLAWRGGNPQRPLEQLQRLGIHVLWLEPQNLAEVTEALRELRTWSPDPEKADAAIEQFISKEKVCVSAMHNKPCNQSSCSSVNSPSSPHRK
ncbi:MAG: Vitamin B12-binding protein [Candidatus Erwinia impunctatus]|nr:Vitamin B12-binding protein [Culicoides impunctatus]